MPLRGIPRILPPSLLAILAEMGHGDEIVIADANFPGVSSANDKTRVIHMQGSSGTDTLRAITQLFPLDQYVEKPAVVMARVDDDVKKGLQVPIWDEYQKIVNAAEGREIKIEQLERFAFYDRAKKAYAIVCTGEGALYANIILKKGVIPA